ncbi:MAG: hypothetical protein Q9195_007528 [Heterodermia aff. obscurata]
MLAIHIAQRFNGEIVNCDALQMYEGLPITTNKIPVPERNSIPHHLLDCISLTEEPWTVTRFRGQALNILEDIKSRGRLPILVGGTHYYTQSVLFKGSVLDENVQQVAPDEQELKWPILGASSEAMLEELKKVDPVMAKTWHPKDKRKVRRSLEIWLTTGQKPSDVYEKQKQGLVASDNNHNLIDSSEREIPRSQDVTSAFQHEPLILWTHAPPSTLHPRLDTRIDSMLDQGLLTEIHSMHHSLQAQESTGKAVDQSRGIWVAIGYKEFMPYLLALDLLPPKDLANLKREAIERTKIRTRQYARSQLRWIRTKLLSALAEEGALGRLFLLDGSDAESWASDVEASAERITAAFLQGADLLPDPRSVCPAAVEMLSPGGRQERRVRHCDVCGKTMTTDDSWRDHVQSMRHRNTVKAKRGHNVALEN